MPPARLVTVPLPVPAGADRHRHGMARLAEASLFVGMYSLAAVIAAVLVRSVAVMALTTLPVTVMNPRPCAGSGSVTQAQARRSSASRRRPHWQYRRRRCRRGSSWVIATPTAGRGRCW